MKKMTLTSYACIARRMANDFTRGRERGERATRPYLMMQSDIAVSLTSHNIEPSGRSAHAWLTNGTTLWHIPERAVEVVQTELDLKGIAPEAPPIFETARILKTLHAPVEPWLDRVALRLKPHDWILQMYGRGGKPMRFFTTETDAQEIFAVDDSLLRDMPEDLMLDRFRVKWWAVSFFEQSRRNDVPAIVAIEDGLVIFCVLALEVDERVQNAVRLLPT